MEARIRLGLYRSVSGSQMNSGLRAVVGRIHGRLGRSCRGYRSYILAIRALTQKLQGIYHHFRCITFVAGLVCPLAGAQVSFDEHLGAFADELFCHVGRIAPSYDVMPFCIFTEFSVAVTVPFRSGKREGSNLGVAAGIVGIGFKVTYIGVFTNVTD